MHDRLHLLQALLRTDFLAFLEKCFATLEPGIAYQENWHIAAMAEALRRVRDGTTKRLIINVPPRSGKSIVTTIAYTAWVLGHDPRQRIICVSYTDALAKAHAAAFRSIVTSAWYRALFPAFQIQRGGDREMETITTARGYRYAVSIAGPVLGRGADLIIGDDPMSPASALSLAVRTRETNLWTTAHRTRLNNKLEGAIILVMQRLHEQDLVGHVSESEAWERLVIPAIAPEPQAYAIGPRPQDVYARAPGEVLHPEREPSEVLDATRRAIGSLTFSAQYQQDPVPPGGNVIRREWLRTYDRPPSQFDRLVVAWDTASTLSEHSDWSVGTVWGMVGTDFYLLDVLRARLEAPGLHKAILALSERWQADATLIEDTELGRAVSQMLRHGRELRPILRKPRFDKMARLLAQSALFEAGQIHLPTEAPWLATYLNELLAFPTGQHDDQVDATSCALLYLGERSARVQPPARRSRASILPKVNRRRAQEALSPQEPDDKPTTEPREYKVPASWQPGDPRPR